MKTDLRQKLLNIAKDKIRLGAPSHDFSKVDKNNYVSKSKK